MLAHARGFVGCGPASHTQPRSAHSGRPGEVYEMQRGVAGEQAVYVAAYGFESARTGSHLSDRHLSLRWVGVQRPALASLFPQHTHFFGLDSHGAEEAGGLQGGIIFPEAPGREGVAAGRAGLACLDPLRP